MFVKTPPMGWNSWNSFQRDINEELIISSAQALIDTGLAALGYNYVVIDDCWSLLERDADGRLVPDPEKFPNGISGLADRIHSMGLKFGMYSCAGTHTCAGYPASFEHEDIDAKTFAEWGVDFLKYDYCFHPSTVPGSVMYRRMGRALLKSGRDILFSACSWGADETKHWIKSTGANMWRTTGDVFDSWESVKAHAQYAPQSLEYGAVNCFPDMDMLIVGIGGRGKVGITGCTTEEYRLHFSLWALLGSPLMIGCDIRSADSDTLEILSNRRLIEINQDPAYNMPFPLNFSYDDETPCETPVYAKMLANGDFAVGLFNLSEHEQHRWTSNIPLDMFGLPEGTGLTLEFEDVWTGEKFKVTNGAWLGTTKPHSCRVFYARVINK